MKNNTNKEKWIDDIMNSTQGMQKAQPGADLYEQITLKLATPKAATKPFPVRQWAAAAILLLVLNVATVVYVTDKDKNTAAASSQNPIASAIQAQTTYNY